MRVATARVDYQVSPELRDVLLAATSGFSSYGHAVNAQTGAADETRDFELLLKSNLPQFNALLVS